MNYWLGSDIEEVIEGIKPEMDALSGQRLLLTGAGGFLGRYIIEVIRHANRRGADIRLTNIENFAVPTKKSEIAQLLVGDNIEHVNCDICNSLETDALGDFDLIVHAAGIASPFYYRAKPIETLSVATTATNNLLNLAKRIAVN